ncbi:MAG: 50S ribosomal protein L4 [Candidatus Woesearchaeota archaeon]|nr:50S ribosomal protein L4 [Candidatus Woesearchaeota archaeon]
MKLKIKSLDNKEKGSKKLPSQFNEEIRPNLINRSVLSLQSKRRQAYGSHPNAGLRHSARISKRRRDWRTSYGIGISRVPRKVMVRRGSRFTWTGAIIPGTKGGRRAHPPRSEKKWEQKINKKENRKAIRSAIAASINEDVFNKKESAPKDYPFIISDKFESIDKTKLVYGALEKIGLSKELKRANEKKVRSGKGKSRNRKYKRKKGPLIVVSKECDLTKSASNIEGVDVVNVKSLNAEVLAPGADLGRITLWTESAIDVLAKERLFL